MANLFTKFARRNFGARRSFGSKVGRAFTGKNPFARKITLGSVIARPAERIISMAVMQTADGAVLAAAGVVGAGALKVVKSVVVAAYDVASDVISGTNRIVPERHTRTRHKKVTTVVDDESGH